VSFISLYEKIMKTLKNLKRLHIVAYLKIFFSYPQREFNLEFSETMIFIITGNRKYPVRNFHFFNVIPEK